MIDNQDLEKELIKDFMDLFYKKMGYYPTVLTNQKPKDNYLNILGLNLEQIAFHFEPYLPMAYGKKLKLSSKTRMRELVELRHIFCSIARQMGYSLKSIGMFLGNRDHTTVIHCLRVFSNLIETDPNFRERYYRIIKQITEHHDNSSAMVSDNKI